MKADVLVMKQGQDNRLFEDVNLEETEHLASGAVKIVLGPKERPTRVVFLSPSGYDAVDVLFTHEEES